MPWCPKCKMEYRNTITVCSDCKVDLVEELLEEDDLVPFFQAEDKAIAERLVKYFDYSGLKAMVQYDEENEIFVVAVPEEAQKKAKKLYQAFYFVERERLEDEENDPNSHTTKEMNEISTKHNEVTPVQPGVLDQLDDEVLNEEMTAEVTSNTDVNQAAVDETEESEEEYTEEGPSGSYVMKADQYKDLNATVWIFLLFGIVGLIVVLLNTIGILNFLNGLLPIFVMSALFVFFLYIGLSSNQKAKKIKSEIEAENTLTINIGHWLKENITDRFLSSIHNDNVSDELNYIHKSQIIKNMLIKEFGEQNSAYLDRLIEEFYSDTFDD